MSVEWMLSSCVLIVSVVVIRFIFRKKIRPCVRYALWLAVALRLLLPFSLWGTEVSVLNLLPDPLGMEAETGQDVLPAFENTVPDGVSKELQAVKNVSSFQAEGKIPEELPESIIRERIRIGWQEALRWGWLFGAVFWGMLILVINLDYGRRLKLGRQKVAKEQLPGNYRCRIPVYTANPIKTPCLFGLFHPAIYVTEKVLEDQKLCGFVLRHETMHYRHHDNWWALVRTFCLCLHWYNPLVWMAAYLSGEDGELACDEKVLEQFEAGVRCEYGRALLALSTGEISGMGRLRISTAMGGSKKQLRERLKMIVDVPGKNVGVQLVLSALAVVILAVTFTGKNIRTEEVQALMPGEEQQGQTTPSIDGKYGTQASLISDDKEQGTQALFTGKGGKETSFAHIPDSGQDAFQAGFEEGQWQGNGVYDEKQLPAFGRILKGDEPYPAREPIRADDVLAADLNFDGWEDLCIRGRSADGLNVPYYCMLWKPEKQKFEYSVTLCNVEVDLEEQWVISQVRGTEGELFITYCRYDEDDALHMVRYAEENKNSEGIEHLELTYVEEDDMYTIPAIVDEERFNVTMVDMAKQALTELYQWTGEKVESACFQVTNVGGVSFSQTPEDMAHSRIFFSRYFGADTQYNISGYDRSISSIGVASGRRVWFSPVLWRVFPKGIETMTDEEVVRWYFERLPISETAEIKTIEQRYPDMDDMWTVQTGAGQWFEVFYNKELREISDVTGPYPDVPQH